MHDLLLNKSCPKPKLRIGLGMIVCEVGDVFDDEDVTLYKVVEGKGGTFDLVSLTTDGAVIGQSKEGLNRYYKPIPDGTSYTIVVNNSSYVPKYEDDEEEEDD